eukprot:4775423-Pyramimonas_sp.AAC.1
MLPVGARLGRSRRRAVPVVRGQTAGRGRSQGRLSCSAPAAPVARSLQPLVTRGDASSGRRAGNSLR